MRGDTVLMMNELQKKTISALSILNCQLGLHVFIYLYWYFHVIQPHKNILNPITIYMYWYIYQLR